MQTFGQAIRELRRAKGLTQRVVAAAVGIDFTYLSKLENDRGEPPSERLVRDLAEVLEADAEELQALAGRIPGELRERAQADVNFARFLRRLPNLDQPELEKIYRQANLKPPKK
jgi:HTH-type transcriptional regulator, competence development regulator